MEKPLQSTNESLFKTWRELTSPYTADGAAQSRLWKEMEAYYTSPKRYYHNLDHVAFMIKLSREYEAIMQDTSIVRFAVFYHDIIYNPLRKDNEEKSAELALNRLSALGLEKIKISKCIDLIMATKSHHATDDLDSTMIVDFDLAILGGTPANYLTYTRQIRKEYSMYPDFLYIKGRKKVLGHFLSMDRIFKTSVFYDLYETRARENISAELEEL